MLVVGENPQNGVDVGAALGRDGADVLELAAAAVVQPPQPRVGQHVRVVRLQRPPDFGLHSLQRRQLSVHVLAEPEPQRLAGRGVRVACVHASQELLREVPRVLGCLLLKQRHIQEESLREALEVASAFGEGLPEKGEVLRGRLPAHLLRVDALQLGRSSLQLLAEAIAKLGPCDVRQVGRVRAVKRLGGEVPRVARGRVLQEAQRESARLCDSRKVLLAIGVHLGHETDLLLRWPAVLLGLGALQGGHRLCHLALEALKRMVALESLRDFLGLVLACHPLPCEVVPALRLEPGSDRGVLLTPGHEQAGRVGAVHFLQSHGNGFQVPFVFVVEAGQLGGADALVAVRAARPGDGAAEARVLRLGILLRGRVVVTDHLDQIIAAGQQLPGEVQPAGRQIPPQHPDVKAELPGHVADAAFKPLVHARDSDDVLFIECVALPRGRPPELRRLANQVVLEAVLEGRRGGEPLLARRAL
mmetsp:Transcript_50859/g.154698  ORF Transcript_50859/g.154698 Transcript_50859/m.154698 type:complete len:474 (-) Transcript_50859:3446-4867(-)